jgi:hypothetical protein
LLLPKNQGTGPFPAVIAWTSSSPDYTQPEQWLALCAPRAFLLIGCSMGKTRSAHSDNLQSWGYFNRAKEVYDLVGIPDRLKFETTTDGHQATSPHTDSDWQQFFEQWLKKAPLSREAG